jgi:hypothetical protein
MLNNLKREIKRQEMSQVMMESFSSNATDNAIKSVFLDDVDTAVLGAENDPEIKALVASIPEYDEQDEELELEIHTLTESLIETDLK